MDDPFDSERNLRHWLAIEDWYLSSHTRQWLNRTPYDDAAEVLARIADDADLNPLTPGFVFLYFFGMTGFATSLGPVAELVDRRRAGVRAAILLAQLDDPRCLAPLCRIWVSGGFRKNKYQEEIEGFLIRFLSAGESQPLEDRPFSEVRGLVRRVWKSNNEWRDLSEKRTQLILAALDYLTADIGTATDDLLQEIAETPARRTNRKRITTAAQAARLLRT